MTSLEIEKWELVGSLIRVWTHWKFSAGFQLPNHNAASLEIYKPNPENEIEFWVVRIEEVQLPNQNMIFRETDITEIHRPDQNICWKICWIVKTGVKIQNQNIKFELPLQIPNSKSNISLNCLYKEYSS